MSDTPWLTLIGLGEDGPDGLCKAGLECLARAEFVMGPTRHLDLLPHVAAEKITWPVPFADGLETLLTLRGRKVVVLASGDPFWFGAGSTLTKRMARGEWGAYPGRSSFSLAANRLGWALQDTLCLALHAAPLTRLRPHLAPGQRIIVLLRDGAAVANLAQYLRDAGFAATQITVLEALGGPKERVTSVEAAETIAPDRFGHPVCAALEIAGSGPVLTTATGRADSWFDNDGQITKRPVRALTLSALAPRPHEHLWDIGGGSGSIALEWLMAHPTQSADCIEAVPERAARIVQNAQSLGQDRLHVVTGAAPDALAGLRTPDAVFVGGGLSTELLTWLVTNLAPGTRLVANAVTLETEALLINAQASHGGDLLRFEMSTTKPLGRKRGWNAAFPIVQWSHTL